MTESFIPTHPGGQADGLRLLASPKTPSSRRERMVLVAGAKGGVGATAIALAVARDLAANAGPTMVANAYPGRADLAVMAGVGLAGVVADPSGPSVSRPIDNRLVLFSTPLTEEPNSERFLTAALDRLPEEGWLVVDAGLAASGWCAALSRFVGRLLLVTTPDDVSRINAYGAVKRLQESGHTPPLGLVVNHCPDTASADGVAGTLSASTERFLGVAAPLAGWLPTASGDPTRQTIGVAA